MKLFYLAYVFWKGIFEKRFLLLQLTKRDFKLRFAGSSLGLLWAFLQPLVMVSILWFVFSYGLRSHAVDADVPYVIWFFSAMIAWNFFAETLTTSSRALNEYSFLVKKVNFRVSLLPLVKVLSSLILHLVFIGILIVILIVHGYYPSIYWFQVFYYLVYLLILLLGLGWLTSAVNVFIKDVSYGVTVLMQLGFWITPVIWNYHLVPEKYAIVLRLNPMFYVVDGYRKTFIYHTPFWQDSWQIHLYAWVICLGLLAFGVNVFRKLRPSFADVI